MPRSRSQVSPPRASAPGKKRKAQIHGPWQENFLEAFLEAGTITYAAQAAGVSRRTVLNERQRNEEFAIAFADADEKVTEQLEREAWRRAIDGSDRLLEFLLKARRPEKYSEHHRVLHTGTVGIEARLDPEKVEEELAAFGMPAALAVARGPDAVRPPEEE